MRRKITEKKIRKTQVKTKVKKATGPTKSKKPSKGKK